MNYSWFGSRHGPILNVNVWDYGERPAAWRDPRLGADSVLTLDFWRAVARTAEGGGLDGLFLADSPSLNEDPQQRPHRFLEPTAIVSHLIGHTERLKFISTISTSFNDPIEVSERYIALDLASNGRVGINVVTTTSPKAARDFGLKHLPKRDDRYRRADEFLRVYNGYWHARRKGDAYLYESTFFRGHTVRRPSLNILENPIIVQAGGSNRGQALAVKHADAVFSAEMTLENAVANRKTIIAASRAVGREAPVILPGLSVVIGSTREEAKRRFAYFEDLGPPGYLITHLNRLLGINLGVGDLDKEFVTIVDQDVLLANNTDGSIGFRRSVYSFAQSGKLTLRELLMNFGGFGHQIKIGTPEDIADAIEKWWTHGACDGFNIIPDVLPSGLERFVDYVVPILKRRNLR